MPRPPALTRIRSRLGRESGLTLLAKDCQRMAEMQRWYALTPTHLARLESENRSWDQDPLVVHGIAVRLRKLGQVVPDPLVEQVASNSGKAAYFATSAGARIAETPWHNRRPASPTLLAHALLAADVGSMLECVGIRVRSEREHRSGLDVNGDIVPGCRSLGWVGSKETLQEPDLVVLPRSGQQRINVEVERRASRPLRDYEIKLKAYQRDQTVAAVWYACASQTTAKRVAKAASEVLPSDYPIRIVVAAATGWPLPALLDQDSEMRGDLASLGY